MAYTTATTPPRPTDDGRRWFMIEGVVLILLGVAALLLPLTAGVFAGVLLGWMLIVSGLVGLLATWRARAHMQLSWSLASAVVAILAGLLIAFRPLAGAVAITLLISAYLFVDGVSHLGLGMDQRKRAAPRWAWVLAIGVLDILLSVALVLMGPVVDSVLVGIVAGVDLVIGGIVLIGLGRGVEAATRVV